MLGFLPQPNLHIKENITTKAQRHKG